MKIAVSILKRKLSEEEAILKINETDADYLHVDVMDGVFTPNISEEYRYLHKSTKPLNVHLMVMHPEEYIPFFASLHAESITIHTEGIRDIESTLAAIKNAHMKCGIAINPETNVHDVSEYLSLVDEVLVLGVHPGVGGQSLIESTISKCTELQKIRRDNDYNYQIFFDGGVNDETAKMIIDADVLIAGSFIAMSDDFQAQIDKLR